MRPRSFALAAMSTAWLVVVGSASAGTTRFHEYTAKYKNPPNPATPLAAGYIGGTGDEYLCGGAFLSDGSLVLAGTAIGPVFDPAGWKVQVLGMDGTAPQSPVTETKDAKGRPQIVAPDWTFVNGAGFLVKLAPGFQTAQKAVRFPWGSGTLTDITTDANGSLYVTGVCGPKFSGFVMASKVNTGLTGTGNIFFGKLKTDLGGLEWCHQIADDLWTAPKLKVLKDGKLSLIASNAYHFDTGGKMLKATKLQTPPAGHAVSIRSPTPPPPVETATPAPVGNPGANRSCSSSTTKVNTPTSSTAGMKRSWASTASGSCPTRRCEY